MTKGYLKTLGIGALLCASVARADDGQNGRNGGFQASIIGSNPLMTIGGVNSGGAPWTVKAGQATVQANGRIEVVIVGLLLVQTGTTGPVTGVAASLVCGDKTTAAVVGTTGSSPLSAAGNAQIQGTIPIPATCAAPVVLVRVDNTGTPGAFIALTGFTAAPQNNNRGDR